MADNRMSLLCELCRIMRDYGLDVDAAWTDRGTVANPGKFEGESIETLYFHSQTLNGEGEQLGDELTLCLTDATERQVFGADRHAVVYALVESSNGFVSGQWLTAQQAETERRHYYEAA